MQPLIAVDRWARTGLALEVHDVGAVRKELLDKLALCFAAFNVVGPNMREDAWDLVDAAVDGNDRNFGIDGFLNRGRQSSTSFGLIMIPSTPLVIAASTSAVCLGELR